MEKDKLAKTMQGLPGVLTQVYFADIRDAMTNFHETMKLGEADLGPDCSAPTFSTLSIMEQLHDRERLCEVGAVPDHDADQLLLRGREDPDSRAGVATAHNALKCVEHTVLGL
jgi:hypothetical protein